MSIVRQHQPRLPMDQKFRNLVVLLEPLFRRLMSMEPVTIDALPKNMAAGGVCLFSERDKHLYVGRTNRMRARLQEHCRPSSTHNHAPFAFTLARQATGTRRASYRKAGSRQELERDPDFKAAFTLAKARVRTMHVRFVQEPDPLRQTLLELYVAIALGTPHNDFDTH